MHASVGEGRRRASPAATLVVVCSLLVVHTIALSDYENSVLDAGGTIQTRPGPYGSWKCPVRDYNSVSRVRDVCHDVMAKSSVTLPVTASNAAFGKRAFAHLSFSGISRIAKICIKPHPHHFRKELSTSNAQQLTPAFAFELEPIRSKQDTALVSLRMTFNLSTCEFDRHADNLSDLHIWVSNAHHPLPKLSRVHRYHANLTRNPANASETVLSLSMPSVPPGPNSFLLTTGPAPDPSSGDPQAAYTYQMSLIASIVTAITLLLLIIIVFLLLDNQHQEVERFDLQANSAFETTLIRDDYNVSQKRVLKRLDRIEAHLGTRPLVRHQHHNVALSQQ